MGYLNPWDSREQNWDLQAEGCQPNCGCSPSNSSTEALTPWTSECDYICRWGLCEVVRVKWGRVGGP